MRTFLTAEWRHLLMVNYPVDPAVLQRWVPPGVELDFWNGETFVSVVGFLFLDTRVLGVPIPGHRDFEEVNLRFYVRKAAKDSWRRGVVFIKELVPRRAIALTARLFYNEPYVGLPMRHELSLANGVPQVGSRVEYSWCRKEAWESVSGRVGGGYAPMVDGSLDQFIAEHYWGYTAQRDGNTTEYQVEHPRWNVAPVEAPALHCDVKQLYGEPFVKVLNQRPASAFLADGSPVTVWAAKSAIA